MNASPTEVQLILNAIDKLDEKVDGVKADVSQMDSRINGRIRKLEDERLLRGTFWNVTKLVVPGVTVGVLIAIIAPLVGG